MKDSENKELSSLEILFKAMELRLLDTEEIEEERKQAIALFKQKSHPEQIIEYAEQLFKESQEHEEEYKEKKDETELYWKYVRLRKLAGQICDMVVNYSIILDLDKQKSNK